MSLNRPTAILLACGAVLGSGAPALAATPYTRIVVALPSSSAAHFASLTPVPPVALPPRAPPQPSPPKPPSSPSASVPTSTAPSAPTSSTSTPSRLPRTGINVALELLAATVLLAAGAGLRVAGVRRRRGDPRTRHAPGSAYRR
ncbi:MAG: hypothetical protein ACR2LV_11235 [Solirubrobacteraceae bacterium]